MPRCFPPELLLLFVIAACGSDHAGHAAAPLPIADIAADSNRDGEVRFDGTDSNKLDWNATTGAIFLANIDDDSHRCKTVDSDLKIALCNDAEDDVVDGAEDAKDLARIRTRPTAEPGDAIGRVEILPAAAKSHVRLFMRSGPGDADFVVIGDDTRFTSAQLVKGLDLAIEAKDIVRDPADWDGYVDLQLTVTSSGTAPATDKVHMRVAPVLTFHHLLEADSVWLPEALGQGRQEMENDVTSALKAAGMKEPNKLDATDQWVQDYFEPGFTSMPGPIGTQQVMYVNYRSANVFNTSMTQAPLRPAGRVVFELRGPDVAGVQQFELDHDRKMDGLNSLGNFETVPPYDLNGVSYPFGRVLRGSTKSFFPDPAFTKMIDAQGQQPTIEIDTSWLLVGHVDETLSFVKAPTPRGWVVLAGDPTLAKKMLEDAVNAGNGDVHMFVGMQSLTDDGGSAEISIKDVLADTEVMQASAEAATEIDNQLAVLKPALGLGDDEIIKVPFLHMISSGKSVAYQPGMVNGLYLSSTRFAAPDPHGPEIDGKDIFKTAFENSLAPIGISIDWIEDWDAYHREFGEVHCGTNTIRKIPNARWWESGR
jgi:protein-arginine deiminase